MRANAAQRLRAAVKDGNLRLVMKLVASRDLYTTNTDPLNGWTSLHYAVCHNHLDIVSFLLQSGHERCSLSVDNDGRTPLMIAAIHKCDKDIAKLLVKTFPDSVQQTSRNGLTAMSYAAGNGNLDFIRIMLQHGVDINKPDRDGSTPLHHAAAWGQFDVVKLLIDNGCNAALRNHAGWTALDYSISTELKKFLEGCVLNAFEERKTRRRRNNTVVGTSGSPAKKAPQLRYRSPSSPMPPANLRSLSFSSPTPVAVVRPRSSSLRFPATSTSRERSAAPQTVAPAAPLPSPNHEGVTAGRSFEEQSAVSQNPVPAVLLFPTQDIPTVAQHDPRSAGTFNSVLQKQGLPSLPSPLQDGEAQKNDGAPEGATSSRNPAPTALTHDGAVMQHAHQTVVESSPVPQDQELSTALLDEGELLKNQDTPPPGANGFYPNHSSRDGVPEGDKNSPLLPVIELSSSPKEHLPFYLPPIRSNSVGDIMDSRSAVGGFSSLVIGK